MPTRTARSGFKHMRDSDLLNLGGTVLAAMTANTNFTNPNPALTVLETALEDYRTKLEASSRRGSPLEVSLKNDSRDALLSVLKQLAFYVNTVANGSLSVILSSGFPSSSIAVKSQVPAIPERLKLADWLQSGQMVFSFDPVLEAWMYEYCYADQKDTDGNIVWPDPLSTTKSRNNLLAPLNPGTIYYARVRSRNGNGVSDWSDPVSLMAR
ncbi:hypothetical protein SAMN05216436_102270 [bacterium A37T11]|nr:hypothetical protein SAMN05216436_102270 [bacterium A37T11]